MYPTNIKYTKDHEWARVNGKTVVVGISDFAAKQLGDVVFVDMPAVGENVKKGKTMGNIESVKTVSDLFSPVSGKVVKRNEALEASPELINQGPYDKGWIVEIEMDNPGDLNDLMDAKAYEDHAAHSGH